MSSAYDFLLPSAYINKWTPTQNLVQMLSLMTPHIARGYENGYCLHNEYFWGMQSEPPKQVQKGLRKQGKTGVEFVWCLGGRGEVSKVQEAACVVWVSNCHQAGFLVCPHVEQKGKRVGWGLKSVISQISKNGVRIFFYTLHIINFH